MRGGCAKSEGEGEAAPDEEGGDELFWGGVWFGVGIGAGGFEERGI